jgi:hypothetical protein
MRVAAQRDHQRVELLELFGHPLRAPRGDGLVERLLRRVRTCRLGPARLEGEAAWLVQYRQLWDARFDGLEQVVSELKYKEKLDEHK